MALCNCSCHYIEPEDGYGDWIEFERTCRIKRTCSECNRNINPGEKYIDGFMFDDHISLAYSEKQQYRFFAYARCLLCEEIMSWANCDCEGYIIGSLWQDIDDAVSDGGVDLDSLGGLSADAFAVIAECVESEWEYYDVEGWDE